MDRSRICSIYRSNRKRGVRELRDRRRDRDDDELICDRDSDDADDHVDDGECVD